MILVSPKLRLEEVSTVRISGVSDILICKDLNTGGAVLYTVLRVRDHEIVRRLLSLYESQHFEDDPLIDNFSSEGAHVFVFPYRKERPLETFYMGDTKSLTECEDICINVILACMTSGLPWPLLYLCLRQGLLNLNRDDSVFINYEIELTDLDAEIRERECVVECARILLLLLESKASLKADSYQLLQKKTANQSYFRFTELYRDIRLAAAPRSRTGIIRRIIRWFRYHSDTIFGMLFWVSLILVIIALAMLFSNLVLGDIPWLRLFINSFKRIGTESLTR
ncbi:MAG: hypothetical protein IKO80_02385 [Lachnospiraceae bacterium]|nr:hypothetical protein [Lachnospiraceae bacterium]